MSKEVHRKPPGSSGQRDRGPAVGALGPASDCWEEDDEEDVLRPLYDVPLSRVEPSLSCLANLGPWQLLLYLSTSNQLLSHGPKIAILRKALRGKQFGGRGLAQLPAWSKALRLWDVLGMFTLQGRGGVATGRGRGLHWAPTSNPRVCHLRLEVFPTTPYTSTLQPRDTLARC